MEQSVELTQISKLLESDCLITIVTTNGFQMFGKIVGIDENAILFRDEDGDDLLIYKWAISTVMRTKNKPAQIREARARYSSKR